MRDTFDTLDFPKDAELRWLLAQGITGEAMASPWPIRGSSVIFDGNVFSFSGDAWCGVGFCLGNADILNPGTYSDDGSLHIHATPLEWLRADRDGICIVQWRDAYGRLRFCVRSARMSWLRRRWISTPSRRSVRSKFWLQTIMPRRLRRER
jgi:hypothetical protein